MAFPYLPDHSIGLVITGFKFERGAEKLLKNKRLEYFALSDLAAYSFNPVLLFSRVGKDPFSMHPRC